MIILWVSRIYYCKGRRAIVVEVENKLLRGVEMIMLLVSIYCCGVLGDNSVGVNDIFLCV